MKSLYPGKRLMAIVVVLAVGTSAYRDFDPPREPENPGPAETRVSDGADRWDPSNRPGRRKVSVNAPRALVGSLDVSINGPTFIGTPGQYTWTADFAGGAQTPQYTWQISWDGLYWSLAGSGATYSNYAGGVDFYLRLVGTRGLEHAETVIFVQAPCNDPTGDCV